MKNDTVIVELFRDELKRSAFFVAVSLMALIVSFVLDHNGGIDPAWADPAWVAIVLCGAPILWDAATGLVIRHDIKADVLVATALVTSIILGEYFAAGEVAFIMSLGGLLEDYSSAKSLKGIEDLAKLVPVNARVIRAGTDMDVAADDVKVGERIRVIAGETIPLDGIIVSGRTSVNQSSLTGESVPVDKAEGDDVFSGTVNQMGTFVMEVTKPAAESSFQRLVAMVESADADRTRIVRLADRWATYLVALVFSITLATYLAFNDIERALTVMIVFCPCAFILATPTAVVAAIGNLAHRNILVRDGDSLERMASVDRVVFDKTGTLTAGSPMVEKVIADGHMNASEVLRFAASAESLSEHPIGRAIASVTSAAKPEEFSVSVGGGVGATVSGKRVLVGSERFTESNGIRVPDSISRAVSEATERGSIAVIVAVDSQPEGVILLSDPVRSDSYGVVEDIRSEGAECIMLTGDNARTAAYITGKVGVGEFRAECRPEDKMAAIREMQSEGHHVCMVGDGINDAPSLKAADVGISLGGTGTGIAVDAADMVLVGDEIGRIPHLQYVSKRMMAKIRNNIVFALGWNCMAVALAAFGIVGPVLGAIVHNVGSVAVVVNSVLLLLSARESVKDRRNGPVGPVPGSVLGWDGGPGEGCAVGTERKGGVEADLPGSTVG